MSATTTGTGELIDHALDAGATRIIVGLGGSATTDGGFGAIRAITAIPRLRHVELLVACDVTTRFGDAATVFGPQKGASPAQVKLLTGRLGRLCQMFDEEFGVDVRDIPGGGAAGGLGGALAALGGRLIAGFELVADERDLFDQLADTDLIITGEGALDTTSFEGKVVGGVAELGEEEEIPVAAVVGAPVHDFDLEGQAPLMVVSLSELFGQDAAHRAPTRCIEDAAGVLLDRLGADNGA